MEEQEQPPPPKQEPPEQPAASEPEQTEQTTPPADEQPDTPPVEEFVVTEELYDRTFEEINELIAHLNDIISRRDFQSWLGFLTPEYIIASTDPEYLHRLEDLGPLRRNNVKLRNLEDFFIHVVVPSRSDVVLDSVEFVDENRVKGDLPDESGSGCAILFCTLRPGLADRRILR